MRGLEGGEWGSSEHQPGSGSFLLVLLWFPGAHLGSFRSMPDAVLSLCLHLMLIH